MITSYFAVKSKAKASDGSPSGDPKSRRHEDEALPAGTNDGGSHHNKRLKRTFSSSDVEALLSSLHDEGWKEALESTWKSLAFGRLATFVAQERRSNTIFPSTAHTWAALNLCPLDRVKVVIVGQDPYHGPGQAHGLCFSVLPGQQVPPSLRNIYKELASDPAIENFTTTPKHGHLERWAKQGVLMLNTVLTVRRGQANSHKKKGWEEVTSAILRVLNTSNNKKKCVFLLWGKPAAAKIDALNLLRSGHHVVIDSSHPSPLGATKTNKPFLGSRCFGRCNEALRAMGHEAIDWRVDGELVVGKRDEDRVQVTI